MTKRKKVSNLCLTIPPNNCKPIPKVVRVCAMNRKKAPLHDREVELQTTTDDSIT